MEDEGVATVKLASEKNTQDRGSPQYVQIQDQRAIKVAMVSQCYQTRGS